MVGWEVISNVFLLGLSILILLLLFSFMREKKSVLLFMVLQAFTICVFFFSIHYIFYSQKNIVFYSVLLFIIFLSFLILNFLDYKEREKIDRENQKLRVQEEYIKNMETVMDIIRREKHDFNNHLNTLLSMCLLKKPDTVEKIESYIKKLTSNRKSTYQFFDSGNDYIDGLLILKSNFAFEHGICLEASFESPLSEIRIDDSHLTSIIGNIIDNAFEAVLEDKSEKTKIVSMLTYVEDDWYNISVSNNGPMISKGSLERIFENGYSTKAGDRKERGFGLYIARQLVRKNGGEIRVLSSEEETEFLICLRLCGEELEPAKRLKHKNEKGRL